MLLAAIKGLHTLVFFQQSAGIFFIVYCAITGRVTRWTGWAIASVLIEGLALALNRGQCPLRTLAENLGEERGSVTDIFLPRWLAERIFVIFTPLFVAGVAGLAARRLLQKQR